MNNARTRARKSGIDFDAAITDTVVVAVEAGRCSVTGIPFVLPAGRGRPHPLAPSVDRIDSSKGYTLGNIRVCVWAVNAACQQWGLDVTLAIFSRALGVPNPSTDAVLTRLQETP